MYLIFFPTGMNFHALLVKHVMSYISHISCISVMALLGHCCVRNAGIRCLHAGIFLPSSPLIHPPPLSCLFFLSSFFFHHPHPSLSHIPSLDCSFYLSCACPIPSLTPSAPPPLPLQLPISIVDPPSGCHVDQAAYYYGNRSVSGELAD